MRSPDELAPRTAGARRRPRHRAETRTARPFEPATHPALLAGDAQGAGRQFASTPSVGQRLACPGRSRNAWRSEIGFAIDTFGTRSTYEENRSGGAPRSSSSFKSSGLDSLKALPSPFFLE